MARKFSLTNKTGATLDLNRKQAFLWQPAGLGWGVEAEYYDVGTSYITGNTKLTHPEPSGSMVFNGYEEYKQFLQFVQVGGLVLGYKPLTDWYYLSCAVIIEKGEIDHENNKLICPVTFTGLSQWYADREEYRKQDENPYNAKTYPYQYNTNTPSGEAGYTYMTTEGKTEIHNGAIASPMKITINGLAVNPRYTLYQNGEIVAEGHILATIQAGRKLVINSRPEQMEIAEYSADGEYIANMYSNSDFTTARLFNLPAGDSEMYFTDDGGALGECIVEVYENV